MQTRPLGYEWAGMQAGGFEVLFAGAAVKGLAATRETRVVAAKMVPFMVMVQECRRIARKWGGWEEELRGLHRKLEASTLRFIY